MSPSRFTIDHFNLNDLLEDSRSNLIVVSIFSSWSGTAFIIESFMNELSDIYTDVKFVQVPVEKVKGAEIFAAGKSYPYVLFLKNGQMIADNEGLISKKRLEQLIQSMLT